MRRVLHRLVFVGDAARRNRLTLNLVSHTVRVGVVRNQLLVEYVIGLIFVDGTRLSTVFSVGHLSIERIYDNLLDHDGSSILLPRTQRALELTG